MSIPQIFDRLEHFGKGFQFFLWQLGNRFNSWFKYLTFLLPIWISSFPCFFFGIFLCFYKLITKLGDFGYLPLIIKLDLSKSLIGSFFHCVYLVLLYLQFSLDFFFRYLFLSFFCFPYSVGYLNFKFISPLCFFLSMTL